MKCQNEACGVEFPVQANLYIKPLHADHKIWDLRFTCPECDQEHWAMLATKDIHRS